MAQERTQQRLSVVQEIMNEIRKTLIKGDLRPGDLLPNEKDLSEKYLASRTAVREAIKMLVALGILEIRRGDGTYVTQDLSSCAVDPLIFTLILNQKTPKQLFELRQMLEIGMLDIVLSEATPKDIERMERTIQNFEKHCRDSVPDKEKLCQDDLEFHFVFAEATHNALFIKLAHAIWEMFAPSIKRTLKRVLESGEPEIRQMMERISAEHRRILNAIKEKNLEKAKKAIYKSLESWRKDNWEELGS